MRLESRPLAYCTEDTENIQTLTGNKDMEVFIATVFALPWQCFENCYKNYPSPTTISFRIPYNFTENFLLELVLCQTFLFHSLSLSHPEWKHPKSHILNPEFGFAFSVILPTAHSIYILHKVFQVQVCCSQQKHWVVSGVQKSSWGFLYFTWATC